MVLRESCTLIIVQWWPHRHHDVLTDRQTDDDSTMTITPKQWLMPGIYPCYSCPFLCQSLAQRIFLQLILAPCFYDSTMMMVDARWLSMLLSSIPLSIPRSSSFSIAAFDRSIKLILSDPSPIIALPCLVSQSLKSVSALVETSLMWPWRVKIHADS